MPVFRIGGREVVTDEDLEGALKTLVEAFSLVEWTYVDQDHEASAGEALMLDTGSGERTLTLPDSPKEGDRISVLDPSGSWVNQSVTITASHPICGEDHVEFSKEYAWVDLVFTSSQWVYRITGP